MPIIIDQLAIIADQGVPGFICNQVVEQVVNIAEIYATPLSEAGQIDYMLDNCYNWC